MVSDGLAVVGDMGPQYLTGNDEADSPRPMNDWPASTDFPHASDGGFGSQMPLAPEASTGPELIHQQQQEEAFLAPASAQQFQQGFASSVPQSRAASPFVPPGDYARATSEPLPGGFVPLSAMGGGEVETTAAAAPVDSSGCEGSGGAMRSDPSFPQSATGYESGDDMDFLSMRHCVNCTGSLPLAGGVCMVRERIRMQRLLLLLPRQLCGASALCLKLFSLRPTRLALVRAFSQNCGHCSLNDNDIFNPSPAFEGGLGDMPGALLCPRLQGDALVAISYDERMTLHEEGGTSTHPERPDRIRAVLARLQAARLLSRCVPLASRPATRDEIEACHSSHLLGLLDSLSEQARLVGCPSLSLNSDTYVNSHSAFCARLSAGSCVEVATAVVRGEAHAGVAVVRPPGHHAESNTSMGFCLFNNAGIAARAAQAAGAERVSGREEVCKGAVAPSCTHRIPTNYHSALAFMTPALPRCSFWTGTCTTATAHRRSSSRTPMSSMSRCTAMILAVSTLAPVPQANVVLARVRAPPSMCPGPVLACAMATTWLLSTMWCCPLRRVRRGAAASKGQGSKAERVAGCHREQIVLFLDGLQPAYCNSCLPSLSPRLPS